MITKFIPVKYNLKLDESKISIINKKLPEHIAILYSIQFKDVALKLEKLLEKTKKITKLMQVLGCSKIKLLKETQAILLVGSGKFHAINIGLETNLPIYIYPELKQVAQKEIEDLQIKKKSSYLNFLNSKNIGIIISTKPGQEKLSDAIKIKDKIKDKNTYLFICNNLEAKEFENFNINSWVNTACPRLDMESNKLINAKDLNFSN